jgi:hypothetical protein
MPFMTTNYKFTYLTLIQISLFLPLSSVQEIFTGPSSGTKNYFRRYRLGGKYTTEVDNVVITNLLFDGFKLKTREQRK